MASTDEIYTRVLQLQGLVEDSIERLVSAGALPYLSWFNFAPTTVFEPQRAGVLTVNDLPALQMARLQGTLEPSAMDRYNGHTWVSPLLDAIAVKLRADMASGGTGIAAAVQDAIFNRGLERDLQTLRDSMDMAGARCGSRGARIPNDMVTATTARALAEYNHVRGDASRDIVRLMAELAQKNIQFAMTTGVEVERVHMEASMRLAEKVLAMQAAIIAAFETEQRAYIAEFDGKLKAIGLDLEVKLKNATLELSYQEALRDQANREQDLLYKKGAAQIAQAEHANTLRLAALNGTVTGYSTIADQIAANSISLKTVRG